MKRILRFAFISFLVLSNQSFSQLPVVQSVINKTNIDSLMFRVQELSGEVQTIIGGTPYTIVSRNKYQPGNDMAANYIKQKLESYGLTTYDQWFSGTGRNVYGVQLGTLYPNKQYIICAHYDNMPSGSVAPGADDNGSGTCAVLEAARIFTQYESEYTIIYALWDEEEQGLVGSAYYALQAYNAGDSIMGVLNMDMIAYDSDNDFIAEVHTRSIANSNALKDLMISTNTLYNLGANLNTINPGSGASDQASFWNRGYGAILLIENYYGGDFNAYYHTVNDLISHYNPAYFFRLSKLTFATLATLTNLVEIVPVELASFSASLNNKIVNIEWSTASELNNRGFEIERAIDFKNFSTIGFVDGNGTTSEQHFYNYNDNIDLTGTHTIHYRLKQIDFDGTAEYSEVIDVLFDMPAEFALNQNYPNPFNPTTMISFKLAKDSYTTLKVYDFLGREVSTLLNEFKSAGSYNISFDASSLPSGTYYYTLSSEGFTKTNKMILLR